MNRNKVVALAIDAPNQQLFDEWITAGELPNIARVAEQGIRVEHSHEKCYRNERCWSLFLSGQENGATGAYFDPSTYRYGHVSVQRESHPLFYSLGPGTRVCQFDFPAPIIDNVDGWQISGWGSELNSSAPLSDPPGLINELIKRHGCDPKMNSGFTVTDCQSGQEELSFRIPSLYQPDELREYWRLLELAVERRTEICLDLLERESWDLFLAMYSESHTANHLFWHAGREYPVPSPLDNHEDPLLAIMRQIDQGIGRIASTLPNDTFLTTFSVDDTAQNTMDLPSMALLPEIMFRLSFTGKAALAEGVAGVPLPPPRQNFVNHWKEEIWRLATAHGHQVLLTPLELEADGEPLNWNPAMWYQNLWPRMFAFALGNVSDGYIRINVKGREAYGIVSPEDFDDTLADLIAKLSQLTDPRTGKVVVERIERMRNRPHEKPEIPPDLIVCWSKTTPFDAVESPDFGRIGPVPFFRSGGHQAHGTCIRNILFARGPGIVPGSTAPQGQLLDVPATILAMMRVKPHYPLTGRPLFTINRA